jgi:choline dehydrogenase-like flavoprotein
MKGVDNRQVKLSRGRFLGGCSGCNGTLCIRGAKQDYDDWGLDGWSGEDFFKYMRKVKDTYTLPYMIRAEADYVTGRNIPPQTVAQG